MTPTMLPEGDEFEKGCSPMNPATDSPTDILLCWQASLELQITWRESLRGSSRGNIPTSLSRDMISE